MTASDERRTEGIEAGPPPEITALGEAPVIRLSVEDRRLVAEEIYAPASPNDALVRAAAATIA